MERCHIFGIGVDRVSMSAAARWALEAVNNRTPKTIITLNPEMVERAQRDPEFSDTLDKADLVVADGAGIVWACGLLDEGVPERVPGIDLMLEIVRLGAADGLRVYLLGAKPGIARKASKALTERYPGLDVVGSHHGYFDSSEEPDILNHIRETAPDVLFVGIGGGKGEKWCKSHKHNLRIPLSMGVGGSFDVVAGCVKRAPGWLQRANLEWLYRLIRQPSRIGRQTTLLAFALRVLKQRHSGGAS